MFCAESPQDTRQFFFSSWKKHKTNQPLTSLEQQIVNVVMVHPEYHSILESISPQDHTAYFPELGQTNPFLHMGLHLAIRDQIVTNRPTGITDIYNQLLKKYIDPLIGEHLLMDNLAECMWQAQRNQGLMDETAYINACYQLLAS